ncbi:hypothetical protein DB32_000033 [Sandaracinus amylolyticus]|uniref:Uncharacterized protein n=1 Tax=Sandaracinus amylolyticus TaxID=927083 RepID=A0A0F6YFV7_9BACT|nr:hypothetical protein DB32_000033 [Sandaracinus amylolyticus]
MRRAGARTRADQRIARRDVEAIPHVFVQNLGWRGLERRAR